MSRRQRLLIPYKISMINYYEYCVVENEHLYGPGKRVLLFLQGCSIHCEGCVNRHLWDFGKGKNATSEEIISFCRDNHVEGITLHGGEPLDQSEGLYPIVKALKKEQFTVILSYRLYKKGVEHKPKACLEFIRHCCMRQI